MLVEWVVLVGISSGVNTEYIYTFACVWVTVCAQCVNLCTYTVHVCARRLGERGY